MTVGGGFVRVYYAILEDSKFVTIYEDDHHLAAWLRLLIVADEIWPSYPPIPAYVRRASFAALVSVGLIDKLPKQTYRIHGLDTERMRRSQHARNAAAMRWQHLSNPPALPEHYVSNAPSNAPSNAQPMPRTRAPSPSPSPSPSPLPPDPPPDLDNGHVTEPALEAYSRFYITPSRDALRFLDEIAAEFGQEATARAIGEAGKDGRDKLLSRAKGLLILQERDAGKSADRQTAVDRAERTRRELESEDERRVRLLSRPMKPLRDLLPDVKLGKAP